MGGVDIVCFSVTCRDAEAAMPLVVCWDLAGMIINLKSLRSANGAKILVRQYDLGSSLSI